MSKKYPHLLSPFQVGNHVFKNRMIASPSSPHHLQGPEPYPNDALTTHYVNKARSGAALVVLSQNGALRARPPEDREYVLKFRAENPNPFNPEYGWDPTGIGRFPPFDLVDGACQHYLAMLTEAIHFYDSKCMMKVRHELPPGYDVSLGNPPTVTVGAMHTRTYDKEITEEILENILEEIELQSILMKEVGFDGVFLHMAYRGPTTARLLSPMTNRRTDKYGGSLENRALFSLMVADRIKQRCGRDFLILASMSGREPEGGFTLEDAVAYARIFTGHIDLLQIVGPTTDHCHATSFYRERLPFLHAAEVIKRGAPDLTIVANGGFQDLDACEDAIASGKADFIGLARAWICNPDFGTLVAEGRNEDVVPCLRCNCCNFSSYYKPWTSFCAVNPVWGLEHRIDGMISPPRDKRKVAVVGGGTAGMEAALTASKRGHEVTLYEKSGQLGGLLKTYENISFKWPHKDFKDYLVRQIGKSGVRVCLNTEADAELIKKEKYDDVIVAIGAEAIVPDIPGIDGGNVIPAIGVFGKEDALAKDVVVVGGGETGVETGMHLAEKGHDVTVLEMAGMLARRSVPIHYYSMFREAWEALPNFRGIVGARCNGITRDGVTYIDAEGREQSVKAGSVVIAVGMKAKTGPAMQFKDAAGRFFIVGDCKAAEDIQRAVRGAFSVACRL